MMRKVLGFTTLLVVAAVLTNALAQGQSPSPTLEEALSLIRSGMSEAGIKRLSTPSYERQETTITYSPLSLDSCNVQIEMTSEATPLQAYPGMTFKFIYTVPLGKLDYKKIGVSYAGAWSKSLTSSRGWEMGHYSVTLPTIRDQRIISGVGTVTSNHKDGRRVTDPSRSFSNSYLEIDFKDKQAAKNVAAAFSQATRICSERENGSR